MKLCAEMPRCRKVLPSFSLFRPSSVSTFCSTVSSTSSSEMEAAMRPTTALNDNVIDLHALLHPGTKFEHPRDVVSHRGLSHGEKRAILASWASDASAIASCPALRAPEGLKAPVTIDEILEALCALDGGPRPPPGGKPMLLRSAERRAAA